MAKAKKDMTPKERREQLIKDRAARLARDAKKQNMTPAELAKKKRDTYLNVVGGAAAMLPIGRVVQLAGRALKGVTTASKASKATKAAPKKSTTTAVTKPRTTSTAAKDKAAASRLKSRAESKAKPSTSVTTSGSRAVKKPGSGVQQVRQAKDKKPDMKNVTPKPRAIAGGGKDKIVGLSNKGKAALATAGGLGAAALLSGKGEKKAKAASVATPTPRPKRPAKKRSTGMSEGNTVAGSSGRRGGDPRKGFASKATPGAKKAAKSKDPRGNQIKAISSLPAGAKRKFGGSYNSKTEKLRNIGGKTYVFSK